MPNELPPGFPPLDDLLPPSDAAYSPPADLTELFTSPDSPLWELADWLKFHPRPPSFEAGYFACVFDMWLKTGLSFAVQVNDDFSEMLIARCEAFRRTVQRKPFGSGRASLHVSGHVD